MKKPADPKTEAAVALAREIFDAVGPIAVRRLFGGVGFYVDGVIFGLVMGGEIYLRTDAAFSVRLESMGSRPLVYTNSKTQKIIRMSYSTLPEEAIDDVDLAAELARHAIMLAAANAATKKSRKKAR